MIWWVSLFEKQGNVTVKGEVMKKIAGRNENSDYF